MTAVKIDFSKQVHITKKYLDNFLKINKKNYWTNFKYDQQTE